MGCKHGMRQVLTWGLLREDLAYLRVNSMDPSGDDSTSDSSSDSDTDLNPSELDVSIARALDTALDDAMQSLLGSGALVLDVRLNEGGWDVFAMHIAARFAEKESIAFSKYAWRRDKKDAKTSASETWLKPSPEFLPRWPVDRPVLLLLSGATCSAAEVFALTMRGLHNCHCIGEPTCGSFSDEMEHRLSNGWRYTLSNEVYTAPDGRVFEACGVPVDLFVPQFSCTDKDQTLDLLVARATAPTYWPSL